MAELTLIEKAPEESSGVDCVEIYMPKSLKHLSELYNFLRNSITEGPASLLRLEGFSIYEVDGFFRGDADKPWEERSLVIRLLLAQSLGTDESQLTNRIRVFGREIADRIAAKEEEIWICNFAQKVTKFRPTHH
jgi:hypothetical protein